MTVAARAAARPEPTKTHFRPGAWREVFINAYGELLKDRGGCLLLGVLVAGVVATRVPDNLFALRFANQAAPLVL